MESLNVKAVLDYPVYLQLKSEQEKSALAANTINKDLGAINQDEYISTQAVPAPNNENNGLSDRFNQNTGRFNQNKEEEEEKPNKIYNEELSTDTETNSQNEKDHENSQANETPSPKESEQYSSTDFGFLSGLHIPARYKNKAKKLINSLGIEAGEKSCTVDNEHYTENDLKNIFYQLYVKKAPDYNQDRKLNSFLKSLADRNMFNSIKNKSLLSHLKTAWYIF